MRGPNRKKDDSKFKNCYLHLRLTPKDWCTYEGSCRINQLALQNGTCDSCQYKKLVNIPMILERLHNERISNENNLCTTISDANEVPRVVVLETSRTI